MAGKWQKLTGTIISEGYGLSETSPVVTANRVSPRFSGTIGVPVPSTEVTLAAPENGRTCRSASRASFACAVPK